VEDAMMVPENIPSNGKRNMKWIAIALGAVLLSASSAGLASYLVKEEKTAKQVAEKPKAQTLASAQPVQTVRCDDGNIAGYIAGGAAGGILGNQVGKGKGNTAATIGGTLTGAYLGGQYMPLRNVTCRQ
jgi:outer membrane lipoprotein SlyB